MGHAAEKIRPEKRSTKASLEAALDAVLKGVDPAVDERRAALRHVVLAVFDLAQSKPRTLSSIEKLKPDFELLLNDDSSASEEDEVEIDVGEGIGELATAKEGRKRVNEYAVTRSIESWAGQVASAGELLERFKIPRNTLSAWRNRGAIIGLRKDMRNYVYPTEQFVDGCPVKGISAVLAVAPNPRSAWLWLRQEHGALEGERPIDLLRSDLITSREKVALVAKRDFD